KTARTLAMVAAGAAAVLIVGGALTVALGALFGPIFMLRFGLAAMGIGAGKAAPKISQLARRKVMLRRAARSAGAALRTAGTAALLSGKRAAIATWGWLKLKGSMAAGLIMKAGRALLFLGRAALRAGVMMLTNPIILVATGIALAGLLIYKHWDKISAFFSGLWTSVSETFSGFWTRTKTRMAEWPGQMLQVGRDLMSGIVRGIREGPGKVWAALKDTVLGGVDKVKGWLGIRSPSRVFMGIGGDMMGGLALGLDRARDGPIVALRDGARAFARTAAGTALAVPLAAQASIGTPSLDAPRFSPSAPFVGAAPRRPASSSGGVTIHIHAAPGMDERAVAEEVRRVLEERDREAESEALAAYEDDGP
ncbi:MAG: hypothetical protein V2J26_05490, partial [Pacificimonas sp.]|nr:hypothetical protein [Pacificimonas sp.]